MKGAGRDRRAALKAALDRLYEEYDREAAAARRGPHVADPVQFVHDFDEAADREVVGFCAAALAFGRVASVMQSVGRVVEAMGVHPARFVREFEPSTGGRPFASLVHRWTRGPDLVALLWVLRQMLEQAGSIESFFLAGHDPAAIDVRGAIESFSSRALALDLSAAYGRVPARPGVAYFFPRPSCGSACKRMNLYLRWMVRRDAIDVGAWKRVRAAQLIVPLDVHVIRLGKCLGLTRYASPGWNMAAEITSSLRAFDPADPVRYDFALCHVGMRDECGFGRPITDARCPLQGFCRPTGRRRPVSRPPSARR